MRVLSVDLGTSNTVAVLSAYGRPPRVVEVDGSATMPSAVFAAEDGRLVVGRDAERRARLDPARYEPNPKRRIDEGSLLLGDVVVPVIDALAAVLHRVAEETIRQLGGERLDELRLTHPAQWGPARRGVLLGAAHRLDGFGANLVTVPEPVAAAAHFASFPAQGQRLRPGQALAVYDLGAGTFDCAVVGAATDGFVVLAEGGLPDLGGLDVDQALAEHLGRQVSVRDPARWQRLLRPQTTADRRAQRALREDVRAAKEALSRHEQADVPLPEPFPDALVTRGELEALIRPSLLRSVEVLAATVRKAGMTPQSLAGIYLVGGSSRIPLVARLIAEQLLVVPTSLDQPETAVALGAHHVPCDGMGMHTADLAPQQPAVARRSASSGQPTRLARARNHMGAQPWDAAGPGLGTAAGPPAPASTPVRHRAGRRNNRMLLAGMAAVVVGAVVAAAIVLTGRDGVANLPTAEECRQQGEQREQDGEGFTRCLRQLAGSVPDRHDCSTDLPADPGAVAPERLPGVSVSCVLESDGARYQVTYTHGNALVSAQSMLDVWATGTKNDRVEAEWAGNGLRGRYVSTVDSGGGLLAFGVDDRPLFGTLIVTGEQLTPDQLADYFERNVLPGT